MVVFIVNHTINRIRFMLICVVLACGEFLTAGLAQSNPPAATPAATQTVPVIDGGVGPCSLDLTVTTTDGKPAGAATVKVHIAYGFGGFRRLDLEAGTNSDGKVKFTGLPSRVRRPPLEFHVSKGELTSTIEYDPASECKGKRDAKLEKQSAAPQ
jgi:hypothetical protein